MSFLRGVHYGKSFEAMVQHQARLQGHLLVSHGQKMVRTAKGNIAVKSDLDFRLLRADGVTVAFDTKSFGQKAWVTASQFTEHQVTRALLYERFGQRAGMLIYLRACDQVFFLPAHVIEGKGLGKRMDAGSGVPLGSFNRFSFGPIFGAPIPSKEDWPRIVGQSW